jgi:AcrR family transcriptional regulator
MGDEKKAKILAAALSVFLRYGFRRVTMNDIAEAAGMSRAALYLLFRNKEDIFVGVFGQWVDDTVAAIRAEMDAASAAVEKIARAFEIWAVQPFDMVMNSPEAKELVECSFDFAEDYLKQGYAKFEAAITPVVASLAGRRGDGVRMEPDRIAHVLASAVRGFKQSAATPDELRALIRALLVLSFGGEGSGGIG